MLVDWGWFELSASGLAQKKVGFLFLNPEEKHPTVTHLSADQSVELQFYFQLLSQTLLSESEQSLTRRLRLWTFFIKHLISWTPPLPRRPVRSCLCAWCRTTAWARSGPSGTRRAGRMCAGPSGPPCGSSTAWPTRCLRPACGPPSCGASRGRGCWRSGSAWPRWGWKVWGGGARNVRMHISVTAPDLSLRVFGNRFLCFFFLE